MTRYLVLRIACLFSVLPCLVLQELPRLPNSWSAPSTTHSPPSTNAVVTSSHRQAMSLFTTEGSTPIASARDLQDYQGGWRIVPSRLPSSWNLQARIPMVQDEDNSLRRFGRVDLSDIVDGEEEGRGKNKYYKKYKKYMLPLLLAYKLKFFTLIPILIGGLVLLTGATGLAGFFFALFAATMGLKGGGDH